MTRGITAKKLVSLGSMILLFVLIVGYGIWRARDVLFGINFTVVGVTDGMSTTGSWLDISGSAPNTNALTIDGETIPTAENGSWKDTIVLLDGYNVVTVSATDKFGRTTSREYRVYYEAPPTTPPAVTAPDEPPTTTVPVTTTTGDTSGTPETAIPTNSTDTTSPASTPGVQ